MPRLALEEITFADIAEAAFEAVTRATTGFMHRLTLESDIEQLHLKFYTHRILHAVT